MAKKPKFIPAKEVERWVEDGVAYIKYEYPPNYCVSQLIIYDNPFGITPIEMTNRTHSFREFDLWCFRSGERHRRLRKLSGRMSSIYLMINPINNKPFYIGSTKGKLSQRLWHHIHLGYRYNNPKKNKIIRDILSKNKKPIIIELCRCPTEFQFEEERRWIRGAKNTHRLTNIQNAR